MVHKEQSSVWTVKLQDQTQGNGNSQSKAHEFIKQEKSEAPFLGNTSETKEPQFFLCWFILFVIFMC